MTDLVSLKELSAEQLSALVHRALDMKQHPADYRTTLQDKGLLVLMQKTSTRTVLAFTSAIHQLGGYAVRMNWNESNFAISPLEYEARYVGTTADAVMARLIRNEDITTFARYCDVPVVNGCDNRYHPSQAVADLLTVLETAGRFDGVRVTYVGVHNNVTNSLLLGATRLGVQVNLVTPIVNPDSVDPELDAEVEASGLVRRFDTLAEAVPHSDFVYTDTWIDMEHFDEPSYQEEKARRIGLMAPFQISAEVMAGSEAHIMHDMPIHPGFEIAAELVDDPRSVIFAQAANRLHSAKAILHDLVLGRA